MERVKQELVRKDSATRSGEGIAIREVSGAVGEELGVRGGDIKTQLS